MDTPEKKVPPVTELDCAACPLDGTNLIEAAAGTGKTFAITRLYLRLLLEKRLVPSEILVVTFTEAATRELRERIRSTLAAALRIAAVRSTGPAGPADTDEPFFHALFGRLDRSVAVARLTEALHAFDSAAIYTIHGFCRQVLFEHAFESGTLFAAGMITDEKELHELVAADFWRRNFYEASPWFLSFAAAEKCTGPGWFGELCKIRKGAEGYRLLPDLPENPDTAGPEASLAATVAAAARLWNSHRAEIAALLASPALKQNSYSPKIIGRICGTVETLLARGFIGQDGAGDIGKIGAASLAAGTKKGSVPPSHPFFEVCEELHAALIRLHEAYRAKLLALKVLFLSQADSALSKEKERRSLLGFDDLLQHVARALADTKSGNSLRNALYGVYKAALIDEFQDTDPVQYSIFEAIFARELPLFFIGDPKQAIYRFRGADIYAYFEASRKVSRRYTLSTNYRSDPLLLDAVNRLFMGHRNPFAFIPVEYRQVKAGLGDTAGVLAAGSRRQEPFVLWLLPRDSADSVEPLEKGPAYEKAMHAVTGEMARLLDRATLPDATGTRAVKPSDMAILVRTNREATMMRTALDEANIPVVLYLSGSVFGTFEAAEFEILLTALAEPQRFECVRAALATSFFGLSGNAIDGLDADDRLWSSYQARLLRCHEEWRTVGILPMIFKLMIDEQVRRRLLPVQGGERRLTNLLHLAELLHAEGLRSGAGMAAMVKWLGEKILNCGDGVPPDEEMLRLESDEEAVRIVTIHKSKGLEYPIVFCPFTWNAGALPADKEFKKPIVFHDPDHDFAASIALGTDAVRRARPLAEEEMIAESIRLFYVAITRARSRCYCIWGPVKGAETSAPAWVLFGRQIDEDPVARLRATISGLSDNAIDAGLAFLREGAASIEVAALPASVPFVRARELPSPEQPVPRLFRGTIAPPRRILSYSGLAHSMPLADRERMDDGGFSRELPAEEPGSNELAAFPRGAEAGTFLHAVLETVDFPGQLTQENLRAIDSGLARFNFDPGLKGCVVRMIRAIAGKVLDPLSGLRLDLVPMNRTVRELEFYFPVGPFLNRDLFEAAGEALPRTAGLYAPPELKSSGGHLKGYIDLVFEWNDRFYIVDWKSNHLGSGEEAYDPAALAGVMAGEHYLLQYHLYAVALHRFLSLRKPGYTYEKNFGGVYYLFLRGLGGLPESRNGIFFDRPPEARTGRLDGLLSGIPKGQ